jgi:hypothetical protein
MRHVTSDVSGRQHGRAVDELEARLDGERSVRHVVGLRLSDDRRVSRSRGTAPGLRQLAQDGRAVAVFLRDEGRRRVAIRIDNLVQAMRARKVAKQAVERPVLGIDEDDVLDALAQRFVLSAWSSPSAPS